MFRETFDRPCAGHGKDLCPHPPRRKPRAGLIATLLLTLTCMPAAWSKPATQKPLSLQEAQQRALNSDQGVAAARSDRSAAASDARAADQLPDPKVAVRLVNLPLDSFSLSATPMTQTQVALQQSLPPGDTLAQRALKADARTAMATADVALKRQLLTREVRRLWLTVYRETREIALYRQQKRLYAKLLHSAETAYSVGRARSEDLVTLRVRLAEIDDAIDKHRGNADAARARLARWIGHRARAPWPEKLPRGLDHAPSQTGSASDLDRQPEIVRLRAQLAEARAETGIAKARFKPRLGFEVGYGMRAGQADMMSAGITVSLPIFAGSRQEPRLIAAQKRAQASQLALDDRAARLHAKANALDSEIGSLAQRIRRYHKHILPELKQVVRLAQGEFGSGRGAFTAMIDADQAVIDARRKLLDLNIERASRLIDLRYILENPA